MPVLRERALIIFEDEVRDGELLKKLKARMILQMLPPHRYDGTVSVDDSIRFDGKELLSGKKFMLDIPLDTLLDMNLGYDDIFAGQDSKGKKYQLQPIKIRYRSDGRENAMYLFSEYRGLFRTSSGRECYRILSSLVNS